MAPEVTDDPAARGAAGPVPRPGARPGVIADPERYDQLPDRDVLARISDRWSVAVMRVLQRHGPQRYGQLRRHLPGISHKMLTQTLRTIERDGMVLRNVRRQVPLHVEYAATPLGLSSLEPIDVLCRWSREHMAEVAAARARYDAAQG